MIWLYEHVQGFLNFIILQIFSIVCTENVKATEARKIYHIDILKAFLSLWHLSAHNEILFQGMTLAFNGHFFILLLSCGDFLWNERIGFPLDFGTCRKVRKG